MVEAVNGNYVYAGNKEFVPGDRIKRVNEGKGEGAKASDSGNWLDEFVF